jgi:hypothetical protein
MFHHQPGNDIMHTLGSRQTYPVTELACDKVYGVPNFLVLLPIRWQQQAGSTRTEKKMKKLFVIALGCLFWSSALADETESEEHHSAEKGHGKHALALFVGVTREHGEDLGTLGIEYSYRFHENLSAGAVVERADREKNSTLVIAFLHWWPWKELFLGAGVGRKDPGDERQNTLRATIGYEFDLGGGWAIAPSANLDVIEHEEDEEVYGISIGKRF